MPALRIVNSHLQFPTVTLVEPSPSFFIQIAAEIDSRVAFLPGSRRKRQTLVRCKALCQCLLSMPDVLDASVFRAFLVPLGRGAFLKRSPLAVRRARYDVTILIECRDQNTAEQLFASPAYTDLTRVVSENARVMHTITTSNARRIGPVDHSRQGVFVPTDRTRSAVQHHQPLPMDTLRAILPSLVLKQSFHTYIFGQLRRKRCSGDAGALSPRVTTIVEHRAFRSGRGPQPESPPPTDRPSTRPPRSSPMSCRPLLSIVALVILLPSLLAAQTVRNRMPEPSRFAPHVPMRGPPALHSATRPRTRRSSRRLSASWRRSSSPCSRRDPRTYWPGTMRPSRGEPRWSHTRQGGTRMRPEGEVRRR